MTSRAESLRRCRCDAGDLANPPAWCGARATQEDALCDFCRTCCKPEGAQALTVEEVLARDGVSVEERR